MITPTYELTKPLSLNTSRLLIRLTTLGHFLGVIAIFSNRLPLSLQLFLLIALSGHYANIFYCWRHRPVLKLHCYSDAWFLSTESSKKPIYTVLKCSYWHPWLVILQVEGRSNRKSYMPLLIDSCTCHEFKRLQLVAATWSNEN